MARGNKKAKVAPDAVQNSGDANEEMQVDFEGRNIEGQDFHGLKRLMQQVFLKEHVNLSAMSDMLIQQSGIGSVLKQSYDMETEDDDDEEDIDDSDDLFAVSSVLNLTSHKETEVVQQLIELVQRVAKQSKNSATQSQLDAILNGDKKIALLVNERIVNLPAKIAEPMILSLQTELQKMKKRDPSYNFDYFVLICKTCKPKKGKEETYFVNSEEEIFSNEAEVAFEYNVSSQCDSAFQGQWTEDDNEMVPHRKIIFVPGNKLDSIIQNISQVLS